MIRPDIVLFSNMVRKQTISQQMANELVAKPLIIVPMPNADHPHWMAHVTPDKRYSCSRLSESIIPPFNDFVATVDTLYFHITLNNNQVTSVGFCHMGNDNRRYIQLSCAQSAASPQENCVFRLERIYEKDHCVIFQHSSKEFIYAGTSSRAQIEFMAKTILDNFDKYVSSALATILSFLEYQDGLGYYPVKVERDKKPRKGLGSREQLERHQGPHVIYLDRLPSQRSDSGSKTHSDASGGHVRPHERRGHTKTLRHPRYKDHPLYMVENAIRVKPSWVGDKTAIVNGNIYTVLN